MTAGCDLCGDSLAPLLLDSNRRLCDSCGEFMRVERCQVCWVSFPEEEMVVDEVSGDGKMCQFCYQALETSLEADEEEWEDNLGRMVDDES